MFYNSFFPFNENTNIYFSKIIDDLEKNKSKKFHGFDNPNTYLELESLWSCVPSDYKQHKQLEVCGMDNLDETKHPNSNGHQKWVSYLNEKKLNLFPHITIEENILKKFIPHMDEFFKDKDIEYKIFVGNQVYPDSVSGFNRGISKNVAFDVYKKKDLITSVSRYRYVT